MFLNNYPYICGLNYRALKVLQQYRIPFSGLKPGKHQFEFDVDKHFFDEYEYSIVKDGALKVIVELNKQETMMIADFRLSGTISLTCDVCLSSFPAETNMEERVIFKFDDPAEADYDNEDIVVLSRNAFELDTAMYIYEFINLAVPFYSRCGVQGGKANCDEQMLTQLDKLRSAEIQEENIQTDPRWDALKQIKNNN